MTKKIYSKTEKLSAHTTDIHYYSIKIEGEQKKNRSEHRQKQKI